MSDDEIEDLIGTLPKRHPVDRFLPYIEAFREMSDDDRAFGLRQLAQIDVVTAVRAILPEADPVEQADAIARYKRLRADKKAREMLAQEDRADRPDPPGIVSLTDLLQEPDEDAAYRIDGLWPSGGRIVMAAQNKTGKTTLMGNLVRCLVDGDQFLGQFDVERAERVVVVDNESSRRMIHQWLADQGVCTTDAVDLLPLRGALSSFNIMDPTVRTEWANKIGPADVLVFDCLRPALDALGLSEDKESGRFLEALDELLREAGISELVLVHHMGHNNERSRGDSRLEDWPDAKWKLVKEDANDPTSTRYFSAFGRDVDQSEVRLAFNGETRHLSVDGGSRKQDTADRISGSVLLFVASNPGCGVNQIEDGIEGDDSVIRRVLKSLVLTGELVMVKGSRNKHQHYLPGDEP